MLLYDAKVREELGRTKEIAERIRDKVRNKQEAADILGDLPILESAYKQLQNSLPDKIQASRVGQHLGFAKYYLKRSDHRGALSNIDDICDYDLPEVEKNFQTWSLDQSHYDSELAKKIGPLLIQRQWDSAVRKAFVILKERMVKAFAASSSIDGRDLVNEVFGKNGFLHGKIPEGERESMRNLLDGLFGVFRNSYGHRDLEPEWYETEAVLSMVNWTLKTMDRYPGVSVGGGKSRKPK